MGKGGEGKVPHYPVGTDGKARSRICYITIDAKYRDATGTSRRNAHWNADMDQNQQRRLQTTKIYYNKAKKYRIPTPTGTCKVLKYDIKELRLRHENITKRYQDQEESAPRGGKAYVSRRTHSRMGEIQEKTRQSAPPSISAQQEPDEADRTRMGNKTRRMGRVARNTPDRSHMQEQNGHTSRN